MSQTGYTPIQLYRSSTAAAAPSAGSLADGELAINTTDEKLYFKNSSGVVKLLASTSGGTGTVTSVAATGGTGISVTGSPITSSGTLTITNTAPDQVVSLTGAGTTTVTGTYPNFTITSNDQYAGTVTSVDASGGTTGLTFTGGPITSSGTLTLGGTLAVANGGTGATSLTSGYLVKGNGTSAATASVVYDDGTNVGIGTSSPGSKLSVVGRIDATNTQSFLFNGTTGTYGSFQYNGTIVGDIGTANQVVTSGANTDFAITTRSTTALVFGTYTTERMRIDGSGNVGIGTSSPISYSGYGNLTVNGTNGGTFTLRNTANTSSSEMGATAADAYLKTVSSTPLWFGTGNTERVRITSSGNVGIGTSSPSFELDTYKTKTGIVNIAVGNAVGAANDGARFNLHYGGTSIGSYGYTWDGGAFYNTLDFYSDLRFTRQGSEKVRINSSGNVGIGTTSPDAKLDILGTTSDQLRLRTAETEEYRIGRNSSTGYLDFYGSQTGYTGYVFGGVDGERLRITSAGNTVIADGKFITWGNEAQGIYAENASSNLRIYTSSTERLRIDSSGNVCINTTSALGTSSGRGNLTINGTGAIVSLGISGSLAGYMLHDGTDLWLNNTGAGAQRFYTNGTERMRIDSSGNVGIGTSSPGGKLEVSNGASECLLRIRGGTAGSSSPQLQFYGNSSDHNWTIVGIHGDAMTFNKGIYGALGSELMRIDSSGNVGIGTSSPAGKLDISGNFVSNIVAVAASAINCTTGNFFTKTATGALTWTITNPPSSRVYSFLLELTNGGTGTQTWFSGIKWPGGVAPTLTTSGVDVLGFYTDDNGTTWRGVQLMKDSK